MKFIAMFLGIFALTASPLAAQYYYSYSGYSAPENSHLSASDQQVKDNVMRTLRNTRLNKDFPHVKVRADNGVVTLTGFVDSQSDKMVIEDKVSNTEGVQQVDNQIKVIDEIDDQSLQDIRSRQEQDSE